MFYLKQGWIHDNHFSSRTWLVYFNIDNLPFSTSIAPPYDKILLNYQIWHRYLICFRTYRADRQTHAQPGRWKWRSMFSFILVWKTWESKSVIFSNTILCSFIEGINRCRLQDREDKLSLLSQYMFEIFRVLKRNCLTTSYVSYFLKDNEALLYVWCSSFLNSLQNGQTVIISL